MAERDEERLVMELRALGRTATLPQVDPVVMAEVVSDAVSATRRAQVPRRRLAVVALAVLVALLATPPVRAAVADWFGFAGVRVEPGDPRGAAGPPPALTGGPEVQQAADQVTFTLLVPDALGRPDAVEVAPDRRLVSMTWSDDGAVVRLDQLDGTLDFALAKQSREVRYAAVGEVDALWFDEPHEVVVLEPDGSRRTETARLAGHTLIWPRGDTTVRLEGDLTLRQAVRIAESGRPVG